MYRGETVACKGQGMNKIYSGPMLRRRPRGGSIHSRSILQNLRPEGAGRNRVTILRCQPRAKVTNAILSDDGKTGTSTAEDDRYDSFVGR